MPQTISIRRAALDSMGGPIYSESVLQPDERHQEKVKKHIEIFQEALNVLQGLKDLSGATDRMRELLVDIRHQCHRHLTQDPNAMTASRSAFTPTSLTLAQIACEYDRNGQHHDADEVDAQIIRLAQTQMQSLVDQDVDGVSAIGSGFADAARGIGGLSQSLNPLNWAGAVTGDAVTAAQGWFDNQVNTAVEQRMRSMGLDHNKQYQGTSTPTISLGTPSSTPAASTPVLTPAAVPQPNGASVTTPQGTSPASVEDGSLVNRYLGWSWDAITNKNLSSSTVRQDLIQYLAANKQSPAFTQQVLSAYDQRIGSQAAIHRHDAALTSPPTGGPPPQSFRSR